MSDESGGIPPLPILTPENYINRELSTLAFNERVLSLAKEPTIPLLERIKFIAIVGNNLDEFFMVRVGSYMQKQKAGINSARPDGYTSSQVLQEIRTRVTALMIDQRDTMRELLYELEQEGIRICNMEDLNALEREAIRSYFYDEVFPVLTPLAADHARPFPFISNLSLNIGVSVRRTDQRDDEHAEFVRVKVPEDMPRIVNLGKILNKYTGSSSDESLNAYLWIEDVIAQNLDLLFPGMEVVEHHPFRVTRNADIDYEHEQDPEMDISEFIEAGVKERRFGDVVRLSVPDDISKNMLDRLIYELEVDPDRDVYMVRGALGSSSLFELQSVERPELKYPSYVPRLPEALMQGADLFTTIRQGDILMHHPYESFKPVEEFFMAAALDPQVLAIKATLYRVGKNSPVVQALMIARENNKQVAVLVELKARFDEENNLTWARALEHKGVHVTYGVEKLPVKTHAKVALVIRKETTGLRRYVHLGTGNYNSSTARLYTDFGMFTTNEEIADDVTRLFNRLTGFAPATTYKRLLVAPEYLQNRLLDLMDNEIRAALEGKPARLIFKMNQLEEDAVIQKLYQASQAGVKVDLIIRGLCCLKPGIPNLSENIRVRSMLGRYLEHVRVYYFQNAPSEERVYAGSADLMRRNLLNRVEVVFPVMEPRLQNRVLRILATELRNNVLTWEMDSNGVYHEITPSSDELLIESQQILMQDGDGMDIELP